MDETLEYWENIRDQRQEDISCEEVIGDPDRHLKNILMMQLTEALERIEELNG
jgi:hypothetical protein|tara:strand:- start:745 stop:903 length:159 start_codon:yes stop_codon:yes gene_type:complete